MPVSAGEWTSEDVGGDILDEGDDKYNFISDVFARIYGIPSGHSLLFIILDAGNFHHPKVCFGSSGYQIKELEDTRFDINDRAFMAKTILAEKSDEAYVLIYWMVIDGNRVNWAEQKIKEFFRALLNKRRTGLMMRLDIPLDVPVSEGNAKAAIDFARVFISDIASEMSEQDRLYIFGK